MNTPNPIGALVQVCLITPGRSVQRPKVLVGRCHLIRAGVVCLLFFCTTNVGFAQGQRIKLKNASDQPTATVLATDDLLRSTNRTDDASVIKRIVLFPVRLGKRALSVLGLRGENADSKNSRSQSISNAGAVSTAPAELNKQEQPGRQIPSDFTYPPSPETIQIEDVLESNSLSGVVTNPIGESLANVLVERVTNDWQKRIEAVFTDTEGHFAFSSTSTGIHFLKFSKPGFNTQRMKVDVTGKAIHNLEIRLSLSN